MPLLKLETTVVISEDKRQALLASLSKTVAETSELLRRLSLVARSCFLSSGDHIVSPARLLLHLNQDAIDRLVHHALILEFNGESIRAQKAKERQRS